MAQFYEEKTELFIAVVRKYMLLHGNLTQKDLAELTRIGVSTMSRFLSKETKSLNSDLIAKIVAKLEIPMAEIIDFVQEEYEAEFKRLVKFHKGEDTTLSSPSIESESPGALAPSGESVDQYKATGVKARPTEKVSESPKSPASDESRLSTKSTFEPVTTFQKQFMTWFFKLDDVEKKTIIDMAISLGLPEEREFMKWFFSSSSDDRDLLVNIGQSLGFK